MITTIEKTKEEKIKDVINGELKESNEALLWLRNKCISGYDIIWNNPEYTPAEMLGGLDTKAVVTFTDHYKTQVYLQSIDPTWEMLVPPVELTYHEDGSITINE